MNSLEGIANLINELLDCSFRLYGGFYLDKNHDEVVHINITDYSFRIKSTYSNIIYHKVSFSKEQLLNYKQLMREYILGHFGVHMLVLNIIDNIVEIGIDDEDAIGDIISILDKINIPSNAYKVSQKNRMVPIDKDLKKPIIVSNSNVVTSYDYQHQIMAGGWIGMGNTSDYNTTISSVTSVTCGFSYNNWYGVLTCGHGRQVNKYMFWAAPPASGTYPSNLYSYVPSWLVVIGRVQLVDYSNLSSSYLCDLSSTKREFNTTIMAGHAYSGDSFSSFGIEPYVNASGFFTGCANKKVACTVISSSADVIDMRGNQMNDLFFVDQPGIIGTSGGPFYYKHVFNPSTFIVAGMACTTDQSTITGFAKTDHAVTKYGFTPIF